MSVGGTRGLTVELNPEGLKVPGASRRLVDACTLVLRAEKVRNALVSITLLTPRRMAALNRKPDLTAGLFVPSKSLSGWGFSLGLTLPLSSKRWSGERDEAAAIREASAATMDGARRRVAAMIESAITIALPEDTPCCESKSFRMSSAIALRRACTSGRIHFF